MPPVANYPTITDRSPNTEVLLDYIYDTLSGGLSGSPIHQVGIQFAAGDVGNLSLAVRNDGAATQFAVSDGTYYPISVDNKGRVFVVGTQFEDTPHVSGDGGIFALAVRNEGFATLSSADLDYTPIAVGKDGVLYTRVITGTSVIGKVGIDQSTPGTTNYVQNNEMPDATATFAITPYISSAQEASAVVKASAGVLYGFVYTNNNAAVRYVQVFNSASVPPNGTVPTLTFPVQPGAVFSFDCGKFGNFFSAGISMCNSTTMATKTLGSADSLFYVQYK